MRLIRLLPALALSVAACGGAGDSATADTVGTLNDTAGAAAVPGTDSAGAAAGATAPGITAEVRDATGRALGTLTLAAAGTGIQVSGHLTGLPAGEHGIHLHAVGQCAPPFESAGPHWNPTQAKHGTQNPAGPHLGDMPNLTASADSSAHATLTTPAATLDSLLDADGASVVVHAGPDDYKTDPSGGSGNRIACGVVTRR